MKKWFAAGFIFAVGVLGVLAFSSIRGDLQPVYTNPISNISTYRVRVTSHTSTQICFSPGYYRIKNEDSVYNVYIGTAPNVRASTTTVTTDFIGYCIAKSAEPGSVLEINTPSALWAITANSANKSTTTVLYGSY